MTTITLDELETSVREVIAGLAEGGAPVAVTVDGTVVANLLPAGPFTETTPGDDQAPASTDPDAFIAAWDRVAELIGDSWPKGVSAVDAVREQRRG